MGAEVNSAEQAPTETMLDNIEDLLEAARYNDIDDLKSLASAGVSLDSKDSQGRTALHMASANGHLDIVEYLIRHGVERLHEIVHKLEYRPYMEPSVDVNVSNVEQNTPLHWACLNGHIEVVRCLILAGANVSLLNSYERTPVDEAVSRGKMDVVDAINEAIAQNELRGATVNEAVAQDELLEHGT